VWESYEQSREAGTLRNPKITEEMNERKTPTPRKNSTARLIIILFKIFQLDTNKV